MPKIAVELCLNYSPDEADRSLSNVSILTGGFIASATIVVECALFIATIDHALLQVY